MKKRTRIWGTFFCMLIVLVPVSGSLHAKTDWTVVKQFEFSGPVIDMAASSDGSLIFALTSREIVVYSPSENVIESRIPLDETFDRIIFNERNSTLILSGTASNTLKIIRVDKVFEVDVAGMPFRGPENAPVIIAVFDDYQ